VRLSLLKRKSDDCPTLTLVEKLEILLLEVAHSAALSIANDHRNKH
jgi:hypothetical protein